MAPRTLKQKEADRPFRRALEPSAPASLWHSGSELGPPLPPPELWPRDLKRLVDWMVTRNGGTWETWCGEWKRRDDGTLGAEPMWLALRTLAWKLTKSLKVITNEDAWATCIAAARRLTEKERSANREEDAA